MELVLSKEKKIEENSEELKSKIIVNIDRLRKSINTETIIAPNGMSREDRRKFILSFAN